MEDSINNNNKKNNENDNKTKKKNKEEKNKDLITTTTTIDNLAFTKTGTYRTRVESDSMGTIEVPAEHYWGAQTQRSLDTLFNWR